MNAPVRHDALSRERGMASTHDELAAFTSLSSWLTGFDVTDAVGEAAVARRFALFARETPAPLRRTLLDAWRRADASDATEHLRRAVVDDAHLSPWTRALVKLWYQGRWTSPVTGAVVTTPTEPGLMWRAVGALPQGLDAPGLGRWSSPPPMAARAG